MKGASPSGGSGMAQLDRLPARPARLVRLALHWSIRGNCGFWPLRPPGAGAGAGAGHGGALLGDDPTLREREHREDADRWGECRGAAGCTKGQGRARCSSRTTRT